MRARTKRFSAIGAAVGLVVAAMVVAAPASAAPTPEPTPVVSGCSAINGKVVSGTSAGFSNIGLRTGETISVTVAPARTEDRILLTYVMGGFSLNFRDTPATSGLTFVAPADTVYSLSWTLSTTGTPLSSATWTFSSTCSTTSVSPTPTPTPTSPSAPTKPGKGKGGGKK